MADDWKSNVENAYKKWKYNDIHIEVKSYFKNIQHSDFGEPLTKESTSLSSNLSELKDEITTNKDDGKIVSKSEKNFIQRFSRPRGDNTSFSDHLEVGTTDQLNLF